MGGYIPDRFYELVKEVLMNEFGGKTPMEYKVAIQNEKIQAIFAWLGKEYKWDI